LHEYRGKVPGCPGGVGACADSRRLVYHSDPQALYTARFCRAGLGLLATADTYYSSLGLGLHGKRKCADTIGTVLVFSVSWSFSVLKYKYIFFQIKYTEAILALTNYHSETVMV